MATGHDDDDDDDDDDADDAHVDDDDDHLRVACYCACQHCAGRSFTHSSRILSNLHGTAHAGAHDSSDAALHPAQLRQRIFQ